MKEVQLEQYQLVGPHLKAEKVTLMKSTMKSVKEEIALKLQSNLGLIPSKLGKTTACKPQRFKKYLRILMHKQFKQFLHSSQRTTR
jgi:hypothetical protein